MTNSPPDSTPSWPAAKCHWPRLPSSKNNSASCSRLSLAGSVFLCRNSGNRSMTAGRKCALPRLLPIRIFDNHAREVSGRPVPPHPNPLPQREGEVSSIFSMNRSALNVCAFTITAPEDAAPDMYFQSQRDCVLQPRVARNELPWESVPGCANPERVAAAVCHPEQGNTSRNPFRVDPSVRLATQGSSLLATLGFVAESLWDSSSQPQLKIRARRTLAPRPAVTDPLHKTHSYV